MISIIIPCYATLQNNHADYVQRAVQSAMQQNFARKEVIIVDDGSPVRIQNKWGHPVCVYRHEQNQGLSAALNTGIRNSTGDRFIICASDDELRSDCLQKLSKHDADIVCSDFKGDVGGTITCQAADLNTLITKGNCHSYAALIKREMWEKVGGYKSTMNPSWEDYEFFINCAKHGATWAYVPGALHIYHRNPTGRDANAQDKLRLLEGKLHGYHQDLFGKGKGLVTFVIPCYNQEIWLGEALESIKSQIYPHINTIVVDDGSPGRVLDAVKGFPNVLVIRQRNKHLSGARNTGLKYALEHYQSQYLVMLDADDTIEPNFVEESMAAMEANKREYIYCDIKLSGDAWHEYPLKDYDCRMLTKQHLHQCTFLAQSDMYRDIIKQRGYAYDEQMKKGYEDWEFALAALQAKWCGKRHPLPLFHYRHHSSGSMRTEAQDINDELAAYIKSKHTWINNPEALMAACSTCGGRQIRATRVANKNGGMALMFNIPGVGQVDGREPMRVSYNGPVTNVITKIGSMGTIYKYSGVEHRMVDGSVIGPNLTIFARDAHLFNGPFTIHRLHAVDAPAPEQLPQLVMAAAAQAVPVFHEPTEAQRLEAKFQQREATVVLMEPDDFTQLKGVGPTFAEKLIGAGFAYFSDVSQATAEEIAIVLGTDKTKAQMIIDESSKSK